MDKARALAAFESYTSAYDRTNPRIALKVDHTLRVMGLCERIAQAEGFAPHDVELAWLVGLLHDIGRFEQVRRYDTFNDAQSVSHAGLGAELLFEGGDDGSQPIRAFVEDTDDDELIRLAVAHHSDLRLPEGLTRRERALCGVLRDADKIDIIKVNCICPIEDIYGVSEAQMRASELSPACMDIFYQHRCLPRGIRHYPADIMLGHICFAWELEFSESLRVLAEQGHLAQMLSRRWDLPETQDAFDEMASHMHETLGV